ncbi:hypothetical protein IVB22_32405 [Bradyrhizobium sp. 190]|uniref:hypothetical protein n=1 Tax=Bradyrhizobium sp. 190 TaxID=2782658 RepID=UPI001FFBEF0A|nr:hypothetical protein [Bradyrhizobium sp. 190]MCK1517125.1 hypothetical protein [Bradyrhizobium sp. 190]
MLNTATKARSITAIKYRPPVPAMARYGVFDDLQGASTEWPHEDEGETDYSLGSISAAGVAASGNLDVDINFDIWPTDPLAPPGDTIESIPGFEPTSAQSVYGSFANAISSRACRDDPVLLVSSVVHEQEPLALHNLARIYLPEPQITTFSGFIRLSGDPLQSVWPAALKIPIHLPVNTDDLYSRALGSTHRLNSREWPRDSVGAPDLTTRVAYRLAEIPEMARAADSILPGVDVLAAAQQIVGYLPALTVLPEIEIDDSTGAISLVWRDQENAFALEIPNSRIVIGVGFGKEFSTFKPWRHAVSDERKIMSEIETYKPIQKLLSGS